MKYFEAPNYDKPIDMEPILSRFFSLYQQEFSKLEENLGAIKRALPDKHAKAFDEALDAMEKDKDKKKEMNTLIGFLGQVDSGSMKRAATQPKDYKRLQTKSPVKAFVDTLLAISSGLLEVPESQPSTPSDKEGEVPTGGYSSFVEAIKKEMDYEKYQSLDDSATEEKYQSFLDLLTIILNDTKLKVNEIEQTKRRPEKTNDRVKQLAARLERIIGSDKIEFRDKLYKARLKNEEVFFSALDSDVLPLEDMLGEWVLDIPTIKDFDISTFTRPAPPRSKSTLTPKEAGKETSSPELADWIQPHKDVWELVKDLKEFQGLTKKERESILIILSIAVDNKIKENEEAEEVSLTSSFANFISGDGQRKQEKAKEIVDALKKKGLIGTFKNLVKDKPKEVKLILRSAGIEINASPDEIDEFINSISEILDEKQQEILKHFLEFAQFKNLSRFDHLADDFEFKEGKTYKGAASLYGYEEKFKKYLKAKKVEFSDFRPLIKALNMLKVNHSEEFKNFQRLFGFSVIKKQEKKKQKVSKKRKTKGKEPDENTQKDLARKTSERGGASGGLANLEEKLIKPLVREMLRKK
jgi:hypothetical protein